MKWIAVTSTIVAASAWTAAPARAADAGAEGGARDAATEASGEISPCSKDSDCPGATCGAEVCHWPDGTCVPATTDAGTSPGWCVTSSDCKCQASGAICLPPSSGDNQRCSFTTPRNGDAGTCSRDSDCPGAACGGEVCHFPQGTCVPAANDPGWCTVNTDCKCRTAGAVCNGPSADGFSSCSIETLPEEGGATDSGGTADGTATGSSSGGGGSSSGTAGSSGGSGSSSGTASSSSGAAGSSGSGGGSLDAGGSSSSSSSSGCSAVGVRTAPGWGWATLGIGGMLAMARRRRRRA
jgi:hypothetical protein